MLARVSCIVAARRFASTAAVVSMRRAAASSVCPAVAATTFASRRFAATTTAAAADGDVAENPVNVEDWTLDQEIVAKDVAANEKWMDMSKRLEALRKAGDQQGLKASIVDAFALMKEVGAARSPHQCAVLLALESAQIDLNLGNLEAAAEQAASAVAQLEAQTGPARDPVRLAEARELGAFIAVARGDGDAAEKTFRDLLKWIDVGSSKEMPMVRVSAKNMRRTVCTGLGEALVLKSATSGDKRVECREALDHIVDALSQHVDEGDFANGKRTLVAAYKAFMGLSDPKQAAATCDRLGKWCRKFDDEAGAAEAAALKIATGVVEEPVEAAAPTTA